jgi:hypothetical protein
LCKPLLQLPVVKRRLSCMLSLCIRQNQSSYELDTRMVRRMPACLPACCSHARSPRLKFLQALEAARVSPNFARTLVKKEGGVARGKFKEEEKLQVYILPGTTRHVLAVVFLARTRINNASSNCFSSVHCEIATFVHERNIHSLCFSRRLHLLVTWSCCCCCCCCCARNKIPIRTGPLSSFVRSFARLFSPPSGK